MIGQRLLSLIRPGVQDNAGRAETPVRAEWKGTVVAESSEVRTASGYVYFPPDSVRWEHLEPSDHHSVCHWKGVADYYDIVIAGDHNTSAAWSYPAPLPKAEPLAGWVAFWGGVKVRRAKDAGGWSHEGSDPRQSAVVSVDDANFFDVTAGVYTVVDFWAPWCGPCRDFAPIFTSVANDHADRARFGSCNVDDNPKTAALLGITSIPTLVVFGPDGSEVGRHVGVVSRGSLEQIVARLPTT